ncbi:hypothetical protein Dimus_014545 [Dionaea muscipula]
MFRKRVVIIILRSMNNANNSRSRDGAGDLQSSSCRQKERAVGRRSSGAGNSTYNNNSGSPSSVPWLRLKDPRIVRVSRAFGGKDRHSKVCTIRGLRDRRVRLSVSTAVQLYDLQDRLGLSQPSKVVDWLLHAAKDEIDELPPLQIPPAEFIQTSLLSLNKGTRRINNIIKAAGAAAAAHDHNVDDSSTGHDQDLENNNIEEKQTMLLQQDHHHHHHHHSNISIPIDGGGAGCGGFLSSNISCSALQLPQMMNYHTFHQFEPSSFSLQCQSQAAAGSIDHGHTSTTTTGHALAPSLLPFSLPSSGSSHPHHQLFLCTPAGIAQQPYINNNIVHSQAAASTSSAASSHHHHHQVQFLSSHSQHLASVTSSNTQFYPPSSLQSMRAPAFGFNMGPMLALSQHGVGFDPLLKDGSNQFPAPK